MIAFESGAGFLDIVAVSFQVLKEPLSGLCVVVALDTNIVPLVVSLYSLRASVSVGVDHLPFLRRLVFTGFTFDH